MLSRTDLPAGVSVGTTKGVGTDVGPAITGVGATGTSAGAIATPRIVDADALVTPGGASSFGVLGARAVGARGAQHATPSRRAKRPPATGNRHRPVRCPACAARRFRSRIDP